MGKYGSGVSMKTAIELDVKEVEGVLDKYNVAEEDRETVLSVVKEMAYQWCHTNACFCAVEDIVLEEIGDKKYLEVTKKFMRDPGKVFDKMRETYPF